MNRDLAEYYHWEERDRGIRIYMHAAMADRLQADVLRGAEAVPDGRREVGGILLGREEEEGGKPVVIIEDFVPAPCSYQGGPQYDVSDQDAVNLEATLLRVALAGCDAPDAPSILGYYRSHMRDGLSLAPADLLVIDSYFHDPANLFLLVKNVAGTKACTAGFFFWEDGHIQSEFSSLEVALGRTPASAAGPEPEMADDLPSDLADMFRKAALPSAPSAPSAPPPPAKTPRAWPGYVLRAATISIATAALVVSVVTYLGAPRPPRQEAAGSMPATLLGLQVERTPPDLLVTWNRDTREILAARRATLSVLSVRDGKVQQVFELDKAKLATGSYLYMPDGDDLLLRLEVFGADDGSLAQSIRVLLPNRP